MVSKKKRKPGEPVTPDKYQKCSKRSWDGQVRKWRRLLHLWDPPAPPPSEPPHSLLERDERLSPLDETLGELMQLSISKRPAA
jgi:hypothetical protein